MAEKSINSGGLQTFRPSVWQTWRQRWPILIWLGIAILAWWLYDRAGADEALSGILEAPLVEVTVVDTGRVVEVLVVPGQQVAAGAALIRVDTSLIDAEIASTMASLELDRIQRERQYASAIQRVQAELRDLRLRQAADTVEAEIYRVEYQRQQRAYEQQLITVDTIAAVKARAESLEKVSALYPSAIADAERELAGLLALQADNSENEASGEAVRIRTAQLALLKQQREQCTLYATTSGTVAEVHVHPGSVLIAGQSAITLLTRDPLSVYGFIPETDQRTFRLGDSLALQGPHATSTPAAGTVTSISPIIVTIPDTASSLPNRFIRGRPFRLQLESVPADWTPGQSVLISPSRSSWWTGLLGQ
ncbi:MAG: HlyD family efflux transporter periplasmic adaptor subunit [Verrucomicrobiota bacterium]|nr:HlyD family efflux transporter periplasmic adaptor subunit [Verrucomicrobiota bacterium]